MRLWSRRGVHADADARAPAGFSIAAPPAHSPHPSLRSSHPLAPRILPRDRAARSLSPAPPAAVDPFLSPPLPSPRCELPLWFPPPNAPDPSAGRSHFVTVPPEPSARSSPEVGARGAGVRRGGGGRNGRPKAAGSGEGRSRSRVSRCAPAPPSASRLPLSLSRSFVSQTPYPKTLRILPKICSRQPARVRLRTSCCPKRSSSGMPCCVSETLTSPRVAS